LFADPEKSTVLAASPAVELDATPFALVLAAHHAVESSGVLVARRGPIEKRVLLDHGVPVDCRSNLVHETLSRFLAGVGKLSAEAANAALSRSVAQGRLLGELLVEEGALSADELARLLQQNLARKLFDLFTWRDGEARFEPGEHRSESAQRMKVPRLIVTGVERFMPQEAVDRLLGPLAGALLARHPRAEERLAGVRPSEREAALLAELARPRRIEELAAALAASPEELSRLVLALALVGLIAPAEAVAPRAEAVPSQVPVAREAPAPVAREAPAPAAPPAAPVAIAVPSRGRATLAEEEVERLRQRVERRFRERLGQDPFEFLGLPDEASADEIRERYAAFAREFGPWRFEHPGLREVAAEARELFFFGAVCFARLADPDQRDALRRARKARRDEALRTSKASYFKIETDLLDAGAQFAKGVALREAGKLDQALAQLEFAADCDPQNGAYLAEAAWCRYLLAPSTRAVDALAALREAQRVDPKAVEPFLYAGELLSRFQRWSEAELMYRQAAKLLGPEDRRALDALHELGQRKRRKH